MTLADVLARMLEGAESEPTLAGEVTDMLTTPEGRALAALVEAALAWRGVADKRGAHHPMRVALLDAIDAYREATKA